MNIHSDMDDDDDITTILIDRDNNNNSSNTNNNNNNNEQHIDHQDGERIDEDYDKDVDDTHSPLVPKVDSNTTTTASLLKDTLVSLKSFILYCSFSFLFSFDPSEPYIVDYFTNVLHINSTVVYETIYPYWTYSYFIFLLVFGFLGEMIGYKSIIIIGMISKIIASSILLIGTHSIVLLIIDQVADGMAFAAYIVFLAYIYYSLDPKDYQKMACRVNVGYLVGVVLSGLIGQLLVDYVPLIALVTVGSITNVIALIVALCFTNYRSEQLFSFRELCHELLSAYKQTDIIRWYIWSGVAISIHQIVLTYWQSLFLQTSNEEKWNGYISSSAYFFASFVAIIPARLGTNNINNIKNIILIVFGLLGGLLLILMGMGESIIISAISFVVYNCCFEFMSPIVNVQIAKKLNTRIGILFSFNIMIALTIQVIIQLSVGERMLNLDIKNQFFYFGSCLFVLSLGFAVLFTILYLNSKFNISKRIKFSNNNNNLYNHHNEDTSINIKQEDSQIIVD